MLFELSKFYKAIEKELSTTVPTIHSETLKALKDSLNFSDYMLSGVLSFQKYLLYL